MKNKDIPAESKSKALTPIPRKVGQSITMSFPDAMREILNGKKVRRMEWENEEEHCLLKDGWLSIYINGAMHVWKISDGDVEGNDWIVVTN